MPLSDDPDKRARQLANLRPGAGAWQPGAAPNLKHGLRTRNPPVEEVEPHLAAVLADLEPLVPDPLKDEAGDVLPWARESVWTLGVLKLGVVRCLRFLAQHGEQDERGRLRPENEQLGQATLRYRRALAEEAMTLRSRLQAGLDLARTRAIDPSTALSLAAQESDPEARRRLLERAGVLDDDDAA